MSLPTHDDELRYSFLSVNRVWSNDLSHKLCIIDERSPLYHTVWRKGVWSEWFV